MAVATPQLAPQPQRYLSGEGQSIGLHTHSLLLGVRLVVPGLLSLVLYEYVRFHQCTKTTDAKQWKTDSSMNNNNNTHQWVLQLTNRP